MHVLPLTRGPRALRLLSAAALLAGLLGNLGAAQPVQAASLTVTTTTDELNADGDCALREAVRAANLDIAVDACGRGSGADTITLPAGTYTLSLAGGDDAALTGDLDLSGTLTITGAGAATTIIDGSKLDRVVDVLAGANTTLSDLTFRNGFSGDGGAVQNTGTLTILRSTISDSRAVGNQGGYGGGIANRGILSLTNSTVSDNFTGHVLHSYWYRNRGGGIANFPGATATITRSTIRNNIATSDAIESGEGGGIYNMGTMTLIDSTVSSNLAEAGNYYRDECPTSTRGGGIANTGTLTLTNSTVSGNTAGGSDCGGDEGGGIYNEGPLTLSSSTITGNGAGSGGGVSGSMILRNTILAGNTAYDGADCFGTLTSHGYNLIGNTLDCTITYITMGNLLNLNPLLSPLRDNGGPTATHALRPSSPAIDAGNPATPGSGGSACPATDQRGIARPQIGMRYTAAHCDIGAQERQENLVLNSSFEEDSNADGTPDAWSANPRATRSNAAVCSDSYGLQHQATDNANYTVFSDPVVPIIAARAYHFSGWVNIPATSDAFGLELQVRWRDAGGNVLTTVPVQSYTAATSGCTRVTATLTAPPNATQATIRQVVSSLNATLYVDDLRLQMVEDLVINGDFERDSNADGTPDAWSYDPRATHSNATRHGGWWSLRHQAIDNSSYTVFSDPVVPVVAGQPYTVSGWVYITPTRDWFLLDVQVRWRDAAGNVLSTVSVQRYNAATTSWTNFAATLVAPPNATQATLRQVVTSLDATLYVDDLVFGP